MKNQTLIKEAKKLLKELLTQCNEEEQLMFKRMYSPNINLSINESVDIMSNDKIDWAITQVENTIKKSIVNKTQN